MKSLMFAFVLLATTAASACPGGNLKVLKHNGKQIAVVNMSTNTVEVTDSSLNLTTVRFSTQSDSKVICEESSGCANKVELGVSLTSAPSAVLNISLKGGSENADISFDVSNFRVARSIHACAEVIGN